MSGYPQSSVLGRLRRKLPRSRRAFLGQFARSSFAVAVLPPAVLAACGRTETGTIASPSGEQLTWGRTNLGFVSAYVLARGNRATIVDTGVEGSADAIGETLRDLGLNYSDVENVILTHHHFDHAGSTGAVMEQAINATIHAGEADLSEIDYDNISPLVGGEEIFGFEMLHTPGHTAGHMAVIDHDAGLLVGGDSFWLDGDGVAFEGDEQFFSDIPASRESIRRMAELNFDTLLLAHADPLLVGADAALADLAARLD